MYTASYYGLLYAPKSHGCAQVKPSISSYDDGSPYIKKSQIFIENPINEKLKKQFFQIQIPFAWLITNFFSWKHYYIRQIVQNIFVF